MNVLNKIKEIIKKYKNIEEFEKYSEIIICERIKLEMKKFQSIDIFIDEMEKKEKIKIELNDRKKLILLLKYI